MLRFNFLPDWGFIDVHAHTKMFSLIFGQTWGRVMHHWWVGGAQAVQAAGLEKR